jgi:hypothetical protein
MLIQGKERLNSISVARAFPKFYTQHRSSERTWILPKYLTKRPSTQYVHMYKTLKVDMTTL